MKQQKGFATMTPEQKKEIAAAGGRAAHAKGKAHKFDAVTAKAAGQKGGQSVSKDREHMAAIGQKGGHARSRNAGENKLNNFIEKYESQQQQTPPL